MILNLKINIEGKVSNRSKKLIIDGLTGEFQELGNCHEQVSFDIIDYEFIEVDKTGKPLCQCICCKEKRKQT